MKYFISAIGTDSGKTFASAIITQALQADYWKPIQAGTPTDSDKVRSLVTDNIIIHPEQYFLKTPASPHYAAEVENIDITIDRLKLPDTQNNLIIEGAGGLMVPINRKEKMIDLPEHFNAEVILVCNLYLGSINHSLLSIEALQHRNINVKGIIFNGEENPSSQKIILEHTNAPCLLHIRQETTINKNIVNKYASILKKNWNELD